MERTPEEPGRVQLSGKRVNQAQCGLPGPKYIEFPRGPGYGAMVSFRVHDEPRVGYDKAHRHE
jgi:hypothetical protein